MMTCMNYPTQLMKYDIVHMVVNAGLNYITHGADSRLCYSASTEAEAFIEFTIWDVCPHLIFLRDVIASKALHRDSKLYPS